MTKPLIAATLTALLCSCASQSPPPNTYSITYRILSDSVDRKHMLYIKKPGDHTSHKVLASRRPVEQPHISGNGAFITYISFEDEIPALFVQERTTGRRLRVCFLADQTIQTRIARDSSALTVSSQGRYFSVPLIEVSALEPLLAQQTLPFCSAPDTVPPRRRRAIP